jgi:outer membrane autotransporter protein
MFNDSHQRIKVDQTPNSPLSCLLVLGVSLVLPQTATAANAQFQGFLFEACRDARGDLARRCDESFGGDLSGDSEDSLNPTQTLANSTTALAETRARIQALTDKLQKHRANQKTGESKDTMEVFRMRGLSVLLLAESSRLERDANELERGYDSDGSQLQVGFDYRITDAWSVGAIVGAHRLETDFDADSAGRNFDPGNSEGDIESDSVSLNLFTSVQLTEKLYAEALLSYSWSDYDLERIGIFQESTRDLTFNQAVVARASTDGNQMGASLGLGYNHYQGSYAFNLYGRVDYFRSEIDAYTEEGGVGFALRVDDDESDNGIANLGIKIARNINTDHGVWVPQIYAEAEHRFTADRAATRSSLVEDNSNTLLNLSGDDKDKSLWRAGFDLVLVRPNGWSGFLRISRTLGLEDVDQTQFNFGLRMEF